MNEATEMTNINEKLLKKIQERTDHEKIYRQQPCPCRILLVTQCQTKGSGEVVAR